MPPPLKKGQIMTCVNDDFSNANLRGEQLPVKGVNYTIRQVLAKQNKTCLLLVEIVNNPLRYDDGLLECSFDAARFVPRRGRG